MAVDGLFAPMPDSVEFTLLALDCESRSDCSIAVSVKGSVHTQLI